VLALTALKYDKSFLVGTLTWIAGCLIVPLPTPSLSGCI
jgi:hypothetical protein